MGRALQPLLAMIHEVIRTRSNPYSQNQFCIERLSNHLDMRDKCIHLIRGKEHRQNRTFLGNYHDVVTTDRNQNEGACMRISTA